MIRLNDINKTVIDESKVIAYDMFADNFYDSKTGIHKNKEVISLFVERHYIKAYYESKELRDKDIELLDKIFDVKSIEYKAMSVAKPEFYSNEGGINEESKPVKEEYLTWDYVKQFADEELKVVCPNGDIREISFIELGGNIHINIYSNGNIEAFIYSKDLFNALMLKKVE